MFDIPDGVGDGTALGCGIAGLTAWLAVSWRAPVRPDDTVLVLGASGTLGSVAVQASKLLGAKHVIGAARRTDLIPAAADEVFDLSSEDPMPSASLIIDALWGEPLARAFAAAPAGVRIVHLGQSAGADATLQSGWVRGKVAEILGHSLFDIPDRDRGRRLPRALRARPRRRDQRRDRDLRARRHRRGVGEAGVRQPGPEDSPRALGRRDGRAAQRAGRRVPDGERPGRGGGQRADAAEHEGQLGSTDRAEPADQRARERQRRRPGVEVDAEHAPADVVRRAELHHRVRGGRVGREADAADEEQRADEDDVLERGDQQLGDPEHRHRAEDHPPSGLPDAGGDQRADERACAEAGGDDPKGQRARAERLLGEHRAAGRSR